MANVNKEYAKQAIFANREELLAVVSVLTFLLIFLSIIGYFSYQTNVMSRIKNSSFSYLIQEKLLQQKVSNLEDKIVQTRCKLPEYSRSAECQTGLSSIESLWVEIKARGGMKRHVPFSLSRGEEISVEARKAIDGQLQQLRKEQMAEKVKLTEIRYRDSS